MVVGAVESMICAVLDNDGFNPRAPSMRKHVFSGEVPSATVVRAQPLQALGWVRHASQQLASVALGICSNMPPKAMSMCGVPAWTVSRQNVCNFKDKIPQVSVG
jgi:hypothetical protein